MAVPSALDRDLLAEFEAESRRGYADLIAALGQAAHHDTRPRAHDPWSAISRLSECWFAATTLAAPPEAVRTRFPLSESGPLDLLDSLLALAAYSEEPPDRTEQLHMALHQLSAAAQPVSSR